MPSPGDENRKSALLQPGSEPAPGYRLLQPIGAGGFGEVWKAETQGGFCVALKFVRLDAQSGFIEQRALEILKGIRHPNLLTTFGAWQIPGFLVIAMELADRTLSDRFREAVRQGLVGIPYEELIEYLSEAAKGIDYLNAYQHKLEGKEGVGVQHRDIKPQNILLVGNGVKVADFGLARLLEHTITGHTGGLTMAYAAPEFFHGKTSSQSDQYSLAVSYCELRGGRLPFVGAAAQIMAGHLMQPPDLSMLPEQEQPIVARALAKEPKERWPSCRAFVDALRLRPASARVAVPSSSPSAPAPVEESVSVDRYGTLPAADSSKARQAHGHPAHAAAAVTPVPAAAAIKQDTASAEHSATDPHQPLVEESARQPGRPRKGRKALVGAVVALPLIAGLLLWASGALRWPNPEPGPSGSPISTSTPPAGKTKPWLKLHEPSFVSMPAGSKKAIELKFDRQEAEQPIDVTFFNVPAKVHIERATIPAGSNSTQVTVEVAEDAAVGDHTVRVIARSGETKGEYNLALIVHSAPALRLSVPLRLTMRVGEKRSFPVRATREGLEGSIHLLMEDLPAGVSAANVTIPADQSEVDVELTAAANAKRGDQEIRIAAVAGSAKARANLQLTVQRTATLEIDTTPKLVIEAGKSTTLPIKITRDGYTGPVRLTVEGILQGIEPIPDVTLQADADRVPIALTATTRAEEINQEIKIVASGGVLKAQAAVQLQIQPTPSLVHRKKGGEYFRAGEYDRAIIEYTETLRLDPKDVVAYRNRGLAYGGRKEYDKAIPDFTEAIRLDPESSSTLNNRGYAYAEQKEYEKARTDLDKAIRLNPKYALAYRNRGYVHVENKEYDQAIADCTEAIRLGSKEASTYSNRGRAYYNKKDYDQAIADFTEAIRLDPKYAFAHNNRGFAYAERQEYDKALIDLDEAIRLNPQLTLAYRNRGYVHLEKKEYDQAIADYHEAIRLGSKDASTYNNRGRAYYNKKEYERAIADYTEAIRFDRKYTLAYRNRGLVYADKKEYDKAIADYSQAIRLDRKFVLAYFSRGLAYQEKGEDDKAIADYTETIRLNPRYAIAHNNRGNVYRHKKEYDKAIADYHEAIRLDPKYVLPYGNRGNVFLYDKKEYDKAIADYTQAIRLNPKEPVYYQNRAKAYSSKGDETSARADREKAERLKQGK